MTRPSNIIVSKTKMYKMNNVLTPESKIIEAAKQEFFAKGLENAKMQDIADAAGISRTTLNYYFRTKENLFDQIVNDMFNDFIPHFESMLSKEEQDFQNRFEDIVDVYFNFLKQNSDAPRFLIIEIQRNPQFLFDFVRKSPKIQSALFLLRQMLAREVENKNIREMPVEELVTVFYGLLFVPFLINPLVNEFFLKDENKVEAYLEQHKANVKQILIGFLSAKPAEKNVSLN